MIQTVVMFVFQMFLFSIIDHVHTYTPARFCPCDQTDQAHYTEFRPARGSPHVHGSSDDAITPNLRTTRRAMIAAPR